MSFESLIKASKQVVFGLFWAEVFIGTLLWVGAAETLENQVFIICLAVFVYYITIQFRHNKFVFWFMAISVILMLIILYVASSNKYKSKI